ncbi:MAG: hypothetical protein A2Y61_05725 [Chloroflexi bacterium RBG_13_60_13]|nr:MAG: hypothetical protein A2Y61_05725 [Chloroflexi bacterium RBG_13_60_13]
MSLSAKLGLPALAGVLALLAVLGYLGLRAVGESTDQIMDERLVIARTVAQDLDQDISQRLQQLQQIAPEVSPSANGDRMQTAEDILEQLYRYGGPYTQSTFLLDERGHVLLIVPAASDPVGTPPADYSNVLETLQSGRPAVSGAIASPRQADFMVSLSIPLLGSEGEVLGVLGTTFGPTSSFLQTLLSPVDLGETGYAQVINERGLVMATSDARDDDGGFPVTAHADRFARLIQGGDEGAWTCHRCHEPEGEGGRRRDMMAFVPLTIAPWGVAIRQDEGEAFGPRNDLQMKLLSFGGGALALALVAALVVGRILTRPLRRLTLACERIAGGDLDEAVAVTGKDEIGQLGTAFEVMRRRLKESRQQLEERSKALATLEERDRIAREMHDGLSQVLSYVRLATSIIEERLDNADIAAAREELRDVRRASRDAYEDVRQGISALRASGMLKKGFLTALDEFLNSYRAQTQLEVELKVVDEQAVGLGEAAQVQLLRIVQEALANVWKHAQARKVEVELGRSNGRIQVSVADDGRGFDPNEAASEAHRYGLQIMRERAESIGGTLEVLSRPGAGTRIIVGLPSAVSEEEPWNP